MRRALAASARSSMPPNPTRPGAASRRRGASPKSCAVSFASMPADGLVLSLEPGARVDADGVTFTVWAPRHRSLVLNLDDRDIAMEPHRDGYFSTKVAGARAGQRYWFKIDGRL